MAELAWQGVCFTPFFTQLQKPPSSSEATEMEVETLPGTLDQQLSVVAVLIITWSDAGPTGLPHSTPDEESGGRKSGKNGGSQADAASLNHVNIGPDGINSASSLSSTHEKGKFSETSFKAL